MPTPEPQHPPIGTHEGWNLFIDLSDGYFLALKGRKERRSPSLHGIKREVEDENFRVERATERAKKRVEPCVFTYFDRKAKTFHEVEMTSYSDKGVALKPIAGGDIIYVKECWSSDENKLTLLVGQEKHVQEAIEGLRRAQEAYRLAVRGNLYDVKLPSGGEKRAKDLAEHEELIRTEINAATALRKKP